MPFFNFYNYYLSFFMQNHTIIRLGKLKNPHIIKNTFHETYCATNPLVEENMSRDKLITDDSNAY